MNSLLTHLGQVRYETALAEQERRIGSQLVEILLFEPEPVITLGLRSDPRVDVLAGTNLPVLRVSRGGEATYHGPGQLVFFPSFHLPRWRMTVRHWVCFLAQTTAQALRECDIPADANMDRPGVYTSRGKIASIGLKIRGGWNLHGLALNMTEDVAEPFSRIRACGVRNAEIDQVSHWAPGLSGGELASQWSRNFDLNLRRSQKNPPLY